MSSQYAVECGSRIEIHIQTTVASECERPDGAVGARHLNLMLNRATIFAKVVEIPDSNGGESMHEVN